MSLLAAIPGLLSATIVDGEALLDATAASLVAGVTVTFAASTAIYGLATFAECRRQGREAAALGAAVIALAGLLVFAAAIGIGLYVMING
jgi:hypothetical protein